MISNDKECISVSLVWRHKDFDFAHMEFRLHQHIERLKIQPCVFSGGKLGFTIDLGKLHNVSLGQGQEAVAEVAMEKAAKEGHWVILQVCLEERDQFTLNV